MSAPLACLTLGCGSTETRPWPSGRWCREHAPGGRWPAPSRLRPWTRVRSAPTPTSAATTSTSAASEPVTILDAALRYTRLNWHVFPLSANKLPVANCTSCEGGCPGSSGGPCPCLPGGTCHSFHAATLDEALIRQWFTERSRWQLGVRTGAVSGLAVVDVDVCRAAQHERKVEDGDPEGPEHWDLGWLEERLGRPLPGTVMQQTSGGGLHLVYRHPGAGVKVSSRARAFGSRFRALDVKADGGYIVGAPSVSRRTGRAYQWHGGWDVLDEPDAFAP